ncbi:hypothetical protein AB0L82_36385 [Nocardia sp. NPDC052001]|uniref:hypothetical protein n=1 Tax=Nocardia sp. NPDC052001 TaxID=3154853 RepID=UPI00342F72F9
MYSIEGTMISGEIYQPTATVEVRQELATLARRVADVRQQTPLQVDEDGITGWIIDERPVTIGEDDFERWNWSDVAILGSDGELHGGRREQTQNVQYSQTSSDILTISAINVEAWDQFYQETDSRGGRSWLRSGTYLFPRHTERLRRALLMFEESGSWVTDYTSTVEIAPPGPEPGPLFKLSQFVRRFLDALSTRN